jgi:sulfur-carrier protein
LATLALLVSLCECALLRILHQFLNRPTNENGESGMAITIEIPTAFRRFTEGTPKVESRASTVAEALNELIAKFPALSRHVRDDQGQIRQFLNVYLNEEDIRFLGGETCALKDGDRVLLVPSIAGG